jgi:hypothetical protein
MSVGRLSEIPIYPHRAPPTKNQVLSKESQGIPADQARFTASLLTLENQILNKQRQAIHMTRVLPKVTGLAGAHFVGNRKHLGWITLSVCQSLKCPTRTTATSIPPRVRDTLPFNAEIISIGASCYSDTTSTRLSGWSAAVDLYGSG